MANSSLLIGHFTSEMLKIHSSTIKSYLSKILIPKLVPLLERLRSRSRVWDSDSSRMMMDQSDLSHFMLDLETHKQIKPLEISLRHLM